MIEQKIDKDSFLCRNRHVTGNKVQHSGEQKGGHREVESGWRGWRGEI